MKLVKIVTTTPLKNADEVRAALGDAGAGVIGNYDHCSISSLVIGRSTPRSGANPYIGSVDKEGEIEEERIEVVCERDKAKEVIAAMRKAHPYEEPVVDIYPLLTEEEL